MKFKNFLLSCSPAPHRKRIEAGSSDQEKYVNLKPISKRVSVVDFPISKASSSSSSSSKNKSSLKGSKSTNNLYANSAELINGGSVVISDASAVDPSPRCLMVPPSPGDDHEPKSCASN